MIDQFLSNPLFAFGLLFAVVVMLLIFLLHRERNHVARLRGRKGFSPGWSSGRRHRKGSLRGGRDNFQPGWKRKDNGDRKSTGNVEYRSEEKPPKDSK